METSENHCEQKCDHADSDPITTSIGAIVAASVVPKSFLGETSKDNDRKNLRTDEKHHR